MAARRDIYDGYFFGLPARGIRPERNIINTTQPLMSAAHFHLIVNHIPVLGTLFGAGILIAGLWWKQDAVVRVALGLFVIGGVGAAGAYFSGEGAEEIVEGLPGVTEAAVEAHEELAVYAFIAAIVLGVAAIGTLVAYRSRSIPRTASIALLVLSLGVFGVMGGTANLGGQIRHTELRAGAASGVDADARGDTDEDAGLDEEYEED